MEGSYWEMAKRYRRIALAIGEDEMKRKTKFVARLGAALPGPDDALRKPHKDLAAD